MKKLMSYSAIACFALAQATAAYAADDMPMGTNMGRTMMDRAMNTSQPKPETNMDTGLTDGVVKKIDRQNAMITLDHSEIKNAGMPAMTMAYKAQDAAMLDSVKEGEKVQFHLENIKGAYVITMLKKR
jgi:Cu/Ag efflux protein CusF